MPPPKEPPRVSKAYVTGKSSRPRDDGSINLPIKKMAAAVAVVVLGGLGFTAWQKMVKPLEVLFEWGQAPVAPGTSAEDLAVQLRAQLVQLGAQLDDRSFYVVIEEATEE